jgi:Pycsar effector protein
LELEAFTREGATLANSDALTNAGLREVPAPTAAQGNTPERILRETKYFRDLAAVYTDSIRASDFKANIALLFLPLLMVPVLDAHEKGLSHIPLWGVLAPFLIAYFFLIMAIFPRYRKTDKSAFHLSRTAAPHHFTYLNDDAAELVEIRHRVALLSQILWWKTLYIRISLGTCLVALPVFGFALALAGI